MFPVFPSLLQQCTQPEIPILDDVELITLADIQKSLKLRSYGGSSSESVLCVK